MSDLTEEKEEKGEIPPKTKRRLIAIFRFSLFSLRFFDAKSAKTETWLLVRLSAPFCRRAFTLCTRGRRSARKRRIPSCFFSFPFFSLFHECSWYPSPKASCIEKALSNWSAEKRKPFSKQTFQILQIFRVCDHVLSLSIPSITSYPCFFCVFRAGLCIPALLLTLSRRTIPTLFDLTEQVSPKLRRCKSEEILSSWDHFSGTILRFFFILFSCFVIFIYLITCCPFAHSFFCIAPHHFALYSVFIVVVCCWGCSILWSVYWDWYISCWYFTYFSPFFKNAISLLYELPNPSDRWLRDISTKNVGTTIPCFFSPQYNYLHFHFFVYLCTCFCVLGVLTTFFDYLDSSLGLRKKTICVPKIESIINYTHVFIMRSHTSTSFSLYFSPTFSYISTPFPAIPYFLHALYSYILFYTPAWFNEHAKITTNTPTTQNNNKFT